MLLLLFACNGTPDTYENPDRVAGTPQAGAAEVLIDVPMGAPMGGYSARCKILGSSSKVDNRLSPYTVAWAKSMGLHTRPKIKAIWIDNGDDDLILLKFDAIYSYDGIIADVSQRLSEEVGRDLTGKVVLTASHSHAMPANFSDQAHFYLGGDLYNREIYERYAAAMTEAALTAYDRMEPASIGANWIAGWDPDDKVYRDRRGENDELQVWPDQEPGRRKDENALVLRVDDADGQPIAMAVNFGIHGTLLGEDNPMWTGDSVTGLEVALEEQFDSDVVVMHLQGAGGDQSPAGSGDGFARTESIGIYAVDALMAAYDETPTSADAFELEVASRHIPQHRDDIHVTRDGAVDWHYLPYEEGFKPDEVVYEADGSISSPIDEYVFEFGAAFCGSEDPLLKVPAQAEVYPYNSCMDVGLLSGLISGAFGLTVEEFPLPMIESMKAGTMAAVLSGIPIRNTSGEVEDTDLLIGFFPAEPASMFTEQWRRRASAELGVEMPLLVGYAQDHEGYFLIPEDWLMGGYEPNINVWGPLQGEHVMEGVLTLAEDVVLTTEREPADPLGWWSPTTYEDKPLNEFEPDRTPSAGEILTQVDEEFWIPEGIPLELEVPETCARMDCIVQLAWQGGDPAVDLPNVRLQRDDGGTWVDVTSQSGRAVDEAAHDILLAWTPSPLYPVEVEQDHQWWAGWQAIGHYHDRASFPVGTYRLAVDGQVWTGSERSWPWTSEPYALTSDPFEVVPAELDLSWSDASLVVRYPLAEGGWRMAHTAQSGGFAPVDAELTATTDAGDATVDTQDVSGNATYVTLSIPDGATELTVTDAHGNTGTIAL